MRKIYDCDPGCPVQNTLQFIAGKWKSVILYHLFQAGVLRFSELQRKLPYVSKRMLAKQLAELEADGLIIKRIYPVIPVKTEYRLSDFGQSFQPVILAMEAWGDNYIKKPYPASSK
ncbi:winged helix-turn-helix transcriptional regulator [Convivina intestini]|uniref:HxlR family transcriptional regulator n=1 Tax=Convivina intestini TaxID=1505726 RepID=A0A2U1DFE2_9LACO|nr:helix-turn-helix domain-containing protein [Convivina intestini]PVY86289.1 HxlR family transcriptional regulator [Convivina intestini]CAH1851022.1 putative HTH-type transcriptional regulator YybR [Convivina intestini]SDB82208.1 transcriptional regulator, HxlR family [Leuconostocaceae bacterium R-53105]